MHRRATVRQSIVAALGAIPSAPTVIVGQYNPQALTTTPSVTVLTGAEVVDEESSVFYRKDGVTLPQVRQCEFTIEVRAALSSTTVDDELDALALEVELALNADDTLGGEARLIEYVGSGDSELTGEIEEAAGVRPLNYRVWYRVNARDPQALES